MGNADRVYRINANGCGRRRAPRHAIPIHYNDYDMFKSPLSDFDREAKAAEPQNTTICLKHGDTYRFQPGKR